MLCGAPGPSSQKITVVIWPSKLLSSSTTRATDKCKQRPAPPVQKKDNFEHNLVHICHCLGLNEANGFADGGTSVIGGCQLFDLTPKRSNSADTLSRLLLDPVPDALRANLACPSRTSAWAWATSFLDGGGKLPCTLDKCGGGFGPV